MPPGDPGGPGGLGGWFSRMRSKGSRFTLGVWGLRVCSLDGAQPFAALRNRPREVAMAVPMVSSAEEVTFGGFNSRVASFRVAGVALRDIQTCLYRVENRFVWLQKMSSSFRGRRSTLDVSIFILRGRRNTFDLFCGVIFTNRIVRAAASGDKVQILW